MNANTTQPCALDNSSPKERLIQKINDAPLSALPSISAVIEALAFHETSSLESIIENPETCQEERELLSKLVAKTKAEIERARFQPVFTKKQIESIDASIKAQRERRQFTVLVVLCMTEKRLQYMATNQQEAFLLLLEECAYCLDDSKTQLELATAAHSRLLLVGGEV